jgi:hypothetical protein
LSELVSASVSQTTRTSKTNRCNNNQLLLPNTMAIWVKSSREQPFLLQVLKPCITIINNSNSNKHLHLNTITMPSNMVLKEWPGWLLQAPYWNINITNTNSSNRCPNRLPNRLPNTTNFSTASRRPREWLPQVRC